MVEVNHRRIETRRERCGLDAEGIRGAVVFPKSVDEAVGKMRTIEERARRFRAMQNEGDADSTPVAKENEDPSTEPTTTAQQTQEQTPVHLMGRVVHRSEPDLKTHTSYLVFAVLPQEWTEEDEKRCRQTWPSQKAEEVEEKQKSKRQLKQEARERKEKEKEGKPEEQ